MDYMLQLNQRKKCILSRMKIINAGVLNIDLISIYTDTDSIYNIYVYKVE